MCSMESTYFMKVLLAGANNRRKLECVKLISIQHKNSNYSVASPNFWRKYLVFQLCMQSMHSCLQCLCCNFPIFDYIGCPESL